MPIQIEPLRQEHFEPLHNLFDAVCKERRFLAFTEAGAKSVTFAYYGRIIEQGLTHFVAVDGEELLGWCDILPQFGQMRQHVGVLGMAVAAHARGRGIGRLLIQAAIESAERKGLTRIELTVHAENHVAQSLYSSVGFELEGIQKRAWQLDGKYFDVNFMARLGAA